MCLLLKQFLFNERTKFHSSEIQSQIVYVMNVSFHLWVILHGGKYVFVEYSEK